MVVLFSEVVGFTNVAERTEPAALVEAQAVYLEDMEAVISARCREFAQSPPPETWDSVFVLTER